MMTVRVLAFLVLWTGVVAGVSGSAAPAGAGPPGAANASGQPQRPNFVIVFADDQGYGDLGVFGATDFDTPRIDRMASEGMRFTSFYAQVLCGPSRTALLTGSYPIRVAEYGNEKRSFPYVHEQEILLPSLLQAAGYATGMIGKVDITQRRRGWRSELNPVRRGFDEWFGVVGANDSGEVHWVHRNEERIEESAGLDDLTRRYTDEALSFIRRHAERPFFLYVAHTMPHVTGLALYNLETDIGERLNVAAQHPEVVERLSALADEAREELGDYDRIGSGVRFFEDGPRWPQRAAWHGQQ